MRRREFIAFAGAAAAAWPLAGSAQQRGAQRRLGVLMGYVANDPEGAADAAALLQGLGALSWKEGSNLRIDWRWGGSDPALFERYAAELVALGPDLLLAGSSSTATGALHRLTSSIPIVFVNITDPVGQRFVASLARPGGNITGFSNYDPLMVTKWLAMLTQLTPPVARGAVLG
jgi:putative ABC transport system substrate-binding protein